MTHCIFNIKDYKSKDLALVELGNLGFKDFYWIDDLETDSSRLGCWTENALPVLTLKHAELNKALPASEIDWKNQWELFTPNFNEGQATVELNHFCSSLETFTLYPGQGFGDLSHASTRIMLKILGQSVCNRIVIDIGCGSGVLSIAAAKLGARAVYGIDIDPAALDHAQCNIRMNHLQDKIFLAQTLSKETFSEPIIILMNMISSEQKIAWAENSEIFSLADRLIVSGIINEEIDPYLRWCKSKSWTNIQRQIDEEGWTGLELSPSALLDSDSRFI